MTIGRYYKLFVRRYLVEAVLVLIIVILLAVIMAPKLEKAQSTVRIDFSTDEGYAEGNLVGQPRSDDRVWKEGTGSAPADAYILNEALYLSSDANGGKSRHRGRWVLYPLPLWTSGDLTVLWEWRYIGSVNWGFDCGLAIADSTNFGLDGKTAVTWNELSAMVHMQPHGTTIEAADGNGNGGCGYVALQKVVFGFGNKIAMRMHIDLNSQTFDLYAQEEGRAEVLLASKCGFRRSMSRGLDTIAIWENAMLGGASLWVDNITAVGGERGHIDRPPKQHRPHGRAPAAMAAGNTWSPVNTAILGYRLPVRTRSLVRRNNTFQIVKTEADTVRLIFSTFLETESLEATVQKLNRNQTVTKTWNELQGITLGAEAFDVPRAEAILRNPSYLGIGRSNGKPIVDRKTFDRANQLLERLP